MAGTVIATFKPVRSYGWVWLLALTLLIALAAVPLMLPQVVPEEERAAMWIGIAIMVPLLAYMLVTLASVPAMRYDLTTEDLVLACGPLVRYRIPYATIDEVRRTTLKPTLWSSMRMPGLALGGVPYADVGTVKMCAKRMSRDILLITAGRRRYGLTPADEGAFMSQLSPMLPKRPGMSEG